MSSHLTSAFNHTKSWGFVALIPCGFTGGGWGEMGKAESIADDVHPSISAKS